ncbi:lipid A export permease/ATP-binding protein MsbA [Chitinibacter bivalviorum]|uniref:Lipid A export permease/ATP-binding protein MsbA n=1 Tax=Chitinibacter bivalviorum TaxID=2739434 RepID=A0A7H9BQ80_9NEIS|nr:lipid A export permease/ATP-binding protein MsbA [Chitinibacter bivalviorum]QLG89454.1 lipid A export permease/ATP-binding protein MsbA [Chitinibacter bivalviorum]
MNSRQLYFRILSYFVPYKTIAIGVLVAMVIAGSVDALMMRLLKDVIDGFQKINQDGQAAWLMPLMLFGLGLVRLISSFAYEYGSAWLSSRVMEKMRQQMFDRMMAMPIKFFDQSSVGVLLSRVTFDINQIMDAGLNVVSVLVKDTVLAICLLGIMLWTDWQLTLFCLIMLPGAAVSIRVVSKRQRRLSRETQNTMGEMSQILDESLGGQRIIKIFNGGAYESKRFAKANNQVRNLMVKRAATSSLSSGFTVFLIAVAIAAIIYAAGLRAAEGAMTAGSFVSFMGSMMLLQQPIKSLSKINDPLHRGLAAAESVFGLIDQAIEKDEGQYQVERAKGALSIRDLEFAYNADGAKALNKISLDIPPGESVALVGQSGSGKTTLASLLPRFYDTTSGEIRLDDVPLAEYELGNLRQQIALVSQDMVLFNDTVTANIAYGAGSVDMDRVRAAAQAAYATEFIEQMPHGFDEMLGENGVRLSGGQRQRLAIARAIYKDAPVLILDEATSALDTESERKVQEALENLMKGRTTLVIAHRLSTIEKVDRIVVMQSGRIIESGKHAELIAKNGMYAQMHAVQFGGDLA